MSRKQSRSSGNWKASRPRFNAGDALMLVVIIVIIAGLSVAAIAASSRGGMTSGQSNARVVVSRAMASNPGLCYPLEGDYYDWLELTNLGDSPVNLKGWHIADSMDLRGAFTLGDVQLPVGGSVIVYCDDAPANAPEDAIFCGFRLSTEGELIVVADDSQLPVETLNLPPMGRKDMYVRAENGGYEIIDYGAIVEAQKAEAEAAQAAVAEENGGEANLTPEYEAQSLQINEMMPVNRATLTDEDGDHSDWIELYNGGPDVVDLTGWTLSDNDALPEKWALPPVAVLPGEYLIVFASGKDRAPADGEPHANFGLSSLGETLRLYNPYGIVTSWAEYGAAGEDESLSRVPDGSFTRDLPPTPGYANSAELEAEYARRLHANAWGLYINEIMVTGKGSDWVEIYNANGSAVDLSGMGLSDDPGHPRRWQFPDGAKVGAGDYAVVYVNPEGALPEEALGGWAGDFALSEGETVTLCLPNGRIIDQVRLGVQFRDVSIGRAEGYDVYRYFAVPTPGEENAAESYEKKAREITFSHPGGQWAEDTLTLELSTDGDVPIYYTTDGSEPSSSSKVYSEPIVLTGNTMVRARAWRDDVISTATQTHSYILGADHTLRLVLVSGSRSKLNGSSGALVTGAKGSGCDVYLEVYEADGTQLLGQNCHFELMGHGSRLEMAQKGFRLQSQKAYGQGWFEAPLFSHRNYPEYKSVVMRASGQDAFQTHMRDSILCALAADTSLYYQETEVCVVYVNGQYWGVYNMRERVTAESIAQFEGWENPSAINILEGGMDNVIYAVQGSADGYREIIRWVKNHDMSKDDNVAYVEQYIDLDNYLEYVALQIYTCNLDLNNLRLYNNPSEGGRWRWIFFDQDLSYQVDRNNVKDWLSSKGSVGTITSQDNSLFYNLMKNAKMKDRFLTLIGKLLGTTCSARNLEAKMMERYKLLEPEMEMNCKRWKWTTKTWKQYCKNMLNYSASRPEKLKGYLQRSFKLSDADMEEYFGLPEDQLIEETLLAVELKDVEPAEIELPAEVMEALREDEAQNGDAE